MCERERDARDAGERERDFLAVVRVLVDENREARVSKRFLLAKMFFSLSASPLQLHRQSLEREGERDGETEEADGAGPGKREGEMERRRRPPKSRE